MYVYMSKEEAEAVQLAIFLELEQSTNKVEVKNHLARLYKRIEKELLMSNEHGPRRLADVRAERWSDLVPIKKPFWKRLRGKK